MQREAALVDRRAQGVLEGRFHVAQQNAILRALGTCHARLHVRQVEFQHVGEYRIGRVVGAEQALFLGVALDQRDLLFAASGAAHVAERFVIDREEAHCRAVFGRHVGDGRAVGQAQLAAARAVELDELVDHAALAQHLRDGQHQVGRGRAFGQLARQLEADHLRHQHVNRLTEHGGFGFDAADAPAEHAEPVDHGRVAVRADQRIRVGDGLTVLGRRPDDAPPDIRG